jgi:hypothetical protein
VLRDDRPRRQLPAVLQVAHAQRHQVATAQLAVDAQVQQRQIAEAVLLLHARAHRQTSLGLNGAFCPTSFPLFHGTRGLRGVISVCMMDLQLATAAAAKAPVRLHRMSIFDIY